MNINLAITQGASILKDNLIKNPYLDSEILMTKAIEKDRKYILLNSKRDLDKEDLNFFQKLIKKRSIGKPIAYLTNKKFFWNSEFTISDDILIPRPDTELVIEKVLDLTAYKKKLNILFPRSCEKLCLVKRLVNYQIMKQSPQKASYQDIVSSFQAIKYLQLIAFLLTVSLLLTRAC